MTNVVITGSTRGIGFGLATEFLRFGCKVTVSGRKVIDVENAVEKLNSFGFPGKANGKVCDVKDPFLVKELWAFASSEEMVDIWINNAGISHVRESFWTLPTETVQNVLLTNISGMMNGCSVASTEMLKQRKGAIYNLEGFGSNGMVMKGMSIYGTTKAAVKYFTKALALEMKNSPVIIGALAPGMVLTDLLMNDNVTSTEDWAQTKKVFNFLAERVKVVSPWLVRKILNNQKNGVEIKYSNSFRMLKNVLAVVFGHRDIFKDIT
jgi:short-subunit dehydrogenase